MIRLVFFDLGDTLIHDGIALPHVPEALQTISQFRTRDDDALVMGIVSDYLPPAPPVTEAKVAALESHFHDLLSAAGLSDFFVPFEKRVTTSTRAGVNKPDRRIFELAIHRSGLAASLAECLFVTENTGHLAACRDLGMSVLRFGRGAGIHPAFSDWLRAPSHIAAIAGAERSDNDVAAVRLFLERTRGLAAFEGQRTGQTLHGQVRRHVELHSRQLGAVDGILVELPVGVTIHLDPEGDITRVDVSSPAEDVLSDAVLFVKSLLDNKHIALPNEPPGDATHAVDVDANGTRRLVRRRYSFGS